MQPRRADSFPGGDAREVARLAGEAGEQGVAQFVVAAGDEEALELGHPGDQPRGKDVAAPR